MVKFDVMSHKLVPQHVILTPEECEEVLAELKVRKEQLPKIYNKDPCVKALGAQVGEIIRITRDSPTAGASTAYRLVIDI